jgi:cohesin domain-containing protein
MNRTLIAFTVLVIAVMGTPAFAGTLRLGSASITGSQVTVPVVLDGQSGVAAMDFRVNFDSAVLRPVSATAGSSALGANKQVQANLTTDGVYKVIMMGMNRTGVRTGEVAQITFQMLGGSDATQTQLSISNTTFASADGTEMPSNGSSANVVIGEARDETEPEPPDQDSDQEPTDTDDGTQEDGGLLDTTQDQADTQLNLASRPGRGTGSSADTTPTRAGGVTSANPTGTVGTTRSTIPGRPVDSSSIAGTPRPGGGVVGAGSASPTTGTTRGGTSTDRGSSAIAGSGPRETAGQAGAMDRLRVAQRVAGDPAASTRERVAALPPDVTATTAPGAAAAAGGEGTTGGGNMTKIIAIVAIIAVVAAVFLIRRRLFS